MDTHSHLAARMGMDDNTEENKKPALNPFPPIQHLLDLF